MSKIIVTRVHTDDWEGYYINGKLFDQNHSIDESEVFREIAKLIPDFSFQEKEWAWTEDQLDLPEELSGVPILGE